MTAARTPSAWLPATKGGSGRESPVTARASGRFAGGLRHRSEADDWISSLPAIVWAGTDYSVYTMRQASRRSWRIGQTQPVQVVFVAYRNTLQADALNLVAKKLQSSLAVEGELPEDGLAAYGDDLLLALARKIVAGEADAGSVESVFEQARQVAAEAEALLVDADWAAPEPEPVAAAIVAVGADDSLEEGERQRTLFSWAEFMAGEQEGTLAGAAR